MLGEALDAVQAGESLQLTPLLNGIDQAIRASLEKRYFELSWQTLMQGGTTDVDTRKQLIVARPVLDYSDLKPAEPAIQAVRRQVQALGLENRGVRVRLTGEVALAYDELESASRGALLTGLVSLLLVGGLLAFGLRAWQLIAASILTLISGLILTAGFATLALGSLNLISIAFAVLYIGLGIDYSIHLTLRYRELLDDGMPHSSALGGSLRDIGGSLLICTITTATGFYAFIPTAFTGVSELGLIAGTGMIISLALNLSLLPALLCLLPALRSSPSIDPLTRKLSRLLTAITAHGRAVRWSALVIALVSLLLLPKVRFDFNPLHLRNADSESVSTFNELLKNSRTSPWKITVIANSQTESEALAAQLKALPEVDRVITLQQFIPDKQARKLASLQDLSLIMGSTLTVEPTAPVTSDAQQRQALDTLNKALASLHTAEPELNQAAERLHADLQTFLNKLSQAAPQQQYTQIEQLQTSLLTLLPGQLQRLNQLLNTAAVNRDALPDDLVRRWLASGGQYRIDVYPSRPLDNDADLAAFVNAVQRVAPSATEAAVVNLEAGHVVAKSFRQALLIALLAISLLLLILLEKKRDVLLVLTPLLLAALLTGALSVALNLPFNYANVIALPLLLGVGVDSGVHMVHRYRKALPANGDLLGSSTTRGVLLSTLTTICSFGSLAFSPHPGAASMGKMLTLGVGSTLLCMLVLLPALLYRNGQRST